MLRSVFPHESPRTAAGDNARESDASHNQVPAEERAKLVQELLELIKGKVMDIALKHDASRVVQTALQFGNREVKETDQATGRMVPSTAVVVPLRRVDLGFSILDG